VALPAAAVVAFVASAAGSSRGDRTDFEALAVEFDAAAAPASPPATPSTTPPAAPPAPTQPVVPVPAPGPARTIPTTSESPQAPSRLTFGYIGDSKALALATGAIRQPPEGWELGPGFVELGCPLGRGGDRRERPGAHVHPVGPECDWSDLAEMHRGDERELDVAVVWFGSWDVHERRVPELGAQWYRLSDPPYRAWLLEELEQLTDRIVDTLAADVVLVLTLPFDPDFHRSDDIHSWNRLLTEFEAGSDHRVAVLDIVEWAESTGEYDRLLPDDAHPTFGPDGEPNTAFEIHERLLVPRAEALLGIGR